MNPLLTFTEKGIYCPQADVFIDPWRPVAKAIITHGHADHARYGHRHYLCHKDSVAILKYRLGDIVVESKAYGERFSIQGVNFSLHPAGHVLGSSQVRVEYKGEVWVISGDYKIQDDPLAANFEPISCHTFITECTFGLPVYHWPPVEQVAQEINEWWRKNKADGKVSLLSAYSLGKAQRVLSYLDTTIGKVYTHGAISNMNKVLKEEGHELQPSRHLSAEVSIKDLKGNMVLAPPAAIGSPWSHKIKPVSVAMASGWMSLRGAKRRRNVDRGFVVSDHADWNGLNWAIRETGAENIITTHGYTENFTKWLRENGYNALEETTQFEGESVDGDGTDQQEK